MPIAPPTTESAIAPAVQSPHETSQQSTTAVEYGGGVKEEVLLPINQQPDSVTKQSTEEPPIEPNHGDVNSPRQQEEEEATTPMDAE